MRFAKLRMCSKSMCSKDESVPKESHERVDLLNLSDLQITIEQEEEHCYRFTAKVAAHVSSCPLCKSLVPPYQFGVRDHTFADLPIPSSSDSLTLVDALHLDSLEWRTLFNLAEEGNVKAFEVRPTYNRSRNEERLYIFKSVIGVFPIPRPSIMMMRLFLEKVVHKMHRKWTRRCQSKQLQEIFFPFGIFPVQ